MEIEMPVANLKCLAGSYCLPYDSSFACLFLMLHFVILITSSSSIALTRQRSKLVAGSIFLLDLH